MNELYGCSKHDEWTDGALTSIMRKCSEDISSDHHWIILDNDIDPEWIESMNSVMDDNKNLCLANGERIMMTNRMRIIFETGSFAVASPATVSRNGVVYFDQNSLGTSCIINCWMKELPENIENRCELMKNLNVCMK